MSTKLPVAASSATYRKAVNRVAEALREPPNHSRYPSEDFEEIVDLIDEKSRDRAIQWYERGVRRGFIEATNAMLDGQLELKNNTLYCPSNVEISVRVKFRGEEWHKMRIKFTAKDLDFE
ncbi:hypothetical protein AAY86_15090 [Pseudomonas amygdali pv. tabaci str. ATCC 11528]|uniref:hypothetical protein n=1 Tax=Pseudomonas amygdali TaxID=47877 RepID=UPI0001BC8B54|nr:hypothetical protein [Pseudomonas amygdali]KEZ69277.1 hypothetical protein C1E_0208275 [Pseudomonas amygdali pv. tabaci str. ATCC 11528]KKY51702.1 hypothetical protein AAY86_15090 [Pseudomonas amygdali pv. tabaci str. ATCC 11528]QED86677.1 hypothetical protein PSYTB_25000 [Pseudomonas amygdali pv. tabaci str. ATCC 11528]